MAPQTPTGEQTMEPAEARERWHHATMGHERAELEALYARYIQRCNEHRFSELAEFVHDDVEVDGAFKGLAGYAEGLQRVVDTYPDFHWSLQHLLVDDCWLSARLVDTGSTSAGRSITVQEFAMYRIERGGRIAAVWGDLHPPLLPL